MKQLEINKIYNGNYFNLIDAIPDDSINLIVCDGPYGATTHDWDKMPNGIQAFNLNLIDKFSTKLKQGGSLYLFGKPNCIDFIDYRPHLTLQRKIVWYQPSRLAQGKTNYTNNYDIICYFIKGKKPKAFNLDDIRISQMVELAHRKRCENVPSVVNGKWEKTKFNGRGKNPGDVWGDIKQLTYKSKELVSREALNTIQKPLALIERIILASSNENDLVLDPFCGVGTCPIACIKNNRDYIAFEVNNEYVIESNKRIDAILDE